MIEVILPGGKRVRITRSEPAPAAHIIRGLVKDHKLKGEHRLRSAEGVVRGNKKIEDGTFKLEPTD